MSPRAACRLEALGFQHVYDYTLGIADWRAAGLPIEGAHSPTQVVADATRSDAPVATPDEQLGVVLARAQRAGQVEVIVVDCDGVVVGRLRDPVWRQSHDLEVAAVMELGPTTVRPNALLAPLVERMRNHGTDLVSVTTPQGVLLGVLRRADAEQVIAGDPPDQIWADCDGCPGHWSTQ
ncbi:hypothetical protein BMS3Bbin02_00126 [bacterium BMS3Bbin02]|nr:hypothetical protein BMS3Bbin02_00126 [bacterium BMS3Bbin02]